ncbi:MAG: DNA polymerase III subunit gamma/tau [Desulfobacteraceae bacterium 4572_89]|nr:MAG: DNA polymerase III subunit gamma/tau [Desulfobacteraceae bacterium 4572_89]
MSYQVLALKYRPSTFGEVVGQSHVTTTLANAITADRVAHAILFTGPRGTGKTTIARIMAKAMNCSRGPTPDPCNSCKICKDIIQGHCSDVFEIDGASNNSVDQIRDLRENVAYMPAIASHKIYIIDEVHMLSTAAFNALLKTLEEPPEHVIFIFATTEVHKIPATILSRCQRHDLGRIPLEQIAGHLEMLCKKEGFTIEKQSLDLIALEADGSIRDSLSLLDRILSAFPGKKIDHEKVMENLGVLDRKVMHDISSAVFQKDGAALIGIVEAVNDSGLDLKKFFSDIILHFRNLNVIKLCGQESPSINLIDLEKKKLAQAVSELTPNYLGILLQILLDEESLVKFSSHTKTAVEMVLLKLIQINPGAQIDKIINKLDLLAQQIDSKLLEPVSAEPIFTKPGRPALPEPILKQSKQAVPLVAEPTLTEPVPPGPMKNHVMEEMPPSIQAQPAKKIQPHKVQTEAEPRTWPIFLSRIENKLPSIFALLSKGRVHDTGMNSIHIKLQDCSAFEKTRLAGKKQELQTLCRNFLGKKLEISILADTQISDTADRQNANLRAKQTARNAAMNHPLVLDAQQIFNGEIIN